MKVSNEGILREMSQLSSTLATIVSANLKQSAENVEDLVNDQVRAISDFRETVMARALDTVEKMDAELQAKLSAIHQQLQAEVSYHFLASRKNALHLCQITLIIGV